MSDRPTPSPSARRRSERRRQSIAEEYAKDVETYVAAGADKQVQRVMTAVNRVSKQLERWYAAQLADVDLTSGEWAVLARLATAGGRTHTPSELADLTGVVPSSMTHRLDKMVDKGLVDRAPDPDHRSRVLISLSRGGWERFREIVRAADLVDAEVLAVLSTEEQEQLAGLLDTVMRGLDDLVEPAAPPPRP
ncbi:MarR family winged helix-turn-helix transcriptional regulator [Arsenicicoccus dermatophilus]|uniref:MarR family winged helix-turn-helix transcriptional regulator n=1 Tax=Arsenicicoccus dermatophilus TaxID=1076331 RepID=UPI0039172E87